MTKKTVWEVSETEERYIEELLGSLRAKCSTFVTTKSTVITKEFALDFRATLLMNQCFLRAPLGTSFFEAAFMRAAKAANHKVIVAPDGQRFWDIEINGKKISLKSTAAANLRIEKLHISKLCEAAWIQDVRGAAQREEESKKLFDEYTNIVDSIIQLRLFKRDNRYELVEIPGSILAQVADVPRVEFAPDGPSISIPVGKSPPDFTLKLDRSDAKITLANINKSVCNVLGTWEITCPN